LDVANRTAEIGVGGMAYTRQLRPNEQFLQYTGGKPVTNQNNYTQRNLKKGDYRFFRPANSLWLEYQTTWQCDNKGVINGKWANYPFAQGVMIMTGTPPPPTTSGYPTTLFYIHDYALAAQVNSISLSSYAVNVGPRDVEKAMEVIAHIPAEYENDTHMSSILKEIRDFFKQNGEEGLKVMKTMA